MAENLLNLFNEVYKNEALSEHEKRHLARILELIKRKKQSTGAQQDIPEIAKSLALTAKEWEVLQLIGQGTSNEAIAETLHVAISTVRSHIKHIYQKLGVGSRAEGKRIAQSILSKKIPLHIPPG